ncbi:MAG: RMD1 family protein [Chlamydiales bacterium]
MRCYSCCTAASYDIKSLYLNLKDQYSVTLHRDALYVIMPNEASTADIIFFNYGCTVMWGLDKQEESSWLDIVKPYESKPVETLEFEELSYYFGDKPKIENNELTLPDDNPLSLLAFSHGLAQSVKLGTFEERIQKTYNATKHIPEELANLGKTSLSRKEIRRMMGYLFIERNSINLHFEVLDTPEFFWEHPELESLYSLISNEMDIVTRVEVLNQRLDVVHELFEMLGNELNHQHSSRLEWTIIILIIIEVILTVQHDLLKWF